MDVHKDNWWHGHDMLDVFQFSKPNSTNLFIGMSRHWMSAFFPYPPTPEAPLPSLLSTLWRWKRVYKRRARGSGL